MKINRTQAQTLGNLDTTIFNLNTPEQGRIAVTYLPAILSSDMLSSNMGSAKGAIVMMPGMFSNRRFYLSDKGVGLARYLASQGYSCWMVDRRGLGAADSTSANVQTLYHCYQHDVPAIQTLLAQQGYPTAFYLGHSFGGVLNGMSLAHGFLKAEGVAGLINLSSQLTVGKRLLNKPYSALIYMLTGALGKFPSKRLGMGPENESKQVMRDCCSLVGWAKGANKASFWEGFSEISCPVLGFGSVGDRVDPMPGCEAFVAAMGSQDKTFVQLGEQYGHRRDYDHVGMVVSKDAQHDVWPLIHQWLDSKTSNI